MYRGLRDTTITCYIVFNFWKLFVVSHLLSVHLYSDWLQHGIFMCSTVYLAFVSNTNSW